MGIFISYRRSDSQEVVSRIYDRLVGHFPSERIFRDLDSLQPGVQFQSIVNDTISSATVAVIVIGPTWATTKDSDGVQRLSIQTDFVRLEIEGVLKAGIPIVPVAVLNAVLPPYDIVPESLRPMLHWQGAKVRPDPDFHRDMDRLMPHLGHLIKKSEQFANARALADFMQQLSEDCFYAGWLIDFEYILWDAMNNSLEGGYQLGQDFISKRDHSRLWRLMDACTGWIIWAEDRGRIFVPIDVWEEHINTRSQGSGSTSVLLKNGIEIFEEY